MNIKTPNIKIDINQQRKMDLEQSKALQSKGPAFYQTKTNSPARKLVRKVKKPVSKSPDPQQKRLANRIEAKEPIASPKKARGGSGVRPATALNKHKARPTSNTRTKGVVQKKKATNQFSPSPRQKQAKMQPSASAMNLQQPVAVIDLLADVPQPSPSRSPGKQLPVSKPQKQPIKVFQGDPQPLPSILKNKPIIVETIADPQQPVRPLTSVSILSQA